jgi:hypothetical protein
MICSHCGKQQAVDNPTWPYCTWECYVEDVRKEGGPVICPNGLPPLVVRHDGTLLEHEEADHPGYKFPVDVEYVGEKPADLDEYDHSYGPDCHALLHVTGNCILTAYECCYDMWRLDTGKHIGGSSWYVKQGRDPDYWKLTNESLEKIKKWAKENT